MTASRKYIRYLPGLIGASLVVTVITMVIMFVYDQLNQDTRFQKKIAQTVTVIMPPPPPPEIEKLPEPEMEEEVEINEPQEAIPDMPDAPPPGDLGIDAEGGAGGDNFGLIGRRGGRGLLEGGLFGWYGHLLQTQIHDAMSHLGTIRKSTYSIIMEIWINKEGKITKVRLENSTGEASIDSAIKKALEKDLKISEAPPNDLPQPIRLRITSRL